VSASALSELASKPHVVAGCGPNVGVVIRNQGTDMRPIRTVTGRPVRCAIYTRKSVP